MKNKRKYHDKDVRVEVNSKVKKSLGFREISREFVRLSEEFIDGKVGLEEGEMALFEPVSFVVHRKVKDRKLHLEISLRADILDWPERDKGVAGHVADPLPTTWNKGKKPIMEHHYGGNKRIKREIGHLWKECVKQIQNGEAPEQVAATDLLRQCEEYNIYTGRQWTDEWRKCFKVMSQSLAAASTGNFDQAVLLIDQANQLKKDCHKRFKK
ncbi:MAG: hypothetical protein J7L69_10425 [Desulfobulbaceae bacterium]|nr:hypothetical protein [Desulfobulbaceae bacterium]